MVIMTQSEETLETAVVIIWYSFVDAGVGIRGLMPFAMSLTMTW